MKAGPARRVETDVAPRPRLEMPRGVIGDQAKSSPRVTGEV